MIVLYNAESINMLQARKQIAEFGQNSAVTFFPSEEDIYFHLWETKIPVQKLHS